jgi:hypothetical protein
VRCDFSRTVFDRAGFGATSGDERWDEQSWPMTVYRDCDFTRARFPSRAFFGNALFERCVFDGAWRRTQTYTTEAQFVGCTFRGKVQGVNFWGAPSDRWKVLGRGRNAFTDNDFTGADLRGVAFNHVDLYSQRFPGLPEYAVLDRIDLRAAAAVAAIVDWPEEVRRTAARSLRHEADRAMRFNGGSALVSRDWVSRRVPADAREEIFWLLVNYDENRQQRFWRPVP